MFRKIVAPKHFLAIATLCFWNVSYSAVDSSHTKLQKMDDIADAETVSATLNGFLEKVAECEKKNPSKSNNNCYCLYPNELSQLKNSYNKSIKTHPSWQKGRVFWSNDRGGMSLSLEGVRNFLNLENTCAQNK